ncbi:type II toxin-antitoxin system PemK/MazF family toxin [Methylocucumis oryzae]|uniref:type II toxin-antitoxin system PemK/MazF family toxin n=1 Tax=Methylocucumis oryzae TaxID=1632867 RepID=UPI000AB41CBC|nr:type II toxin-antitoxin system PemK/MazF family toxin [Methylocucumis oryzae]
MTYNCYDIVKVPFPFTDRQSTKTRPALVLSDDKAFNSRIGHSVMAMITSTKHSGWPLDTRIEDLTTAGLPAPSSIRLKLFTLDNRLVLAKIRTACFDGSNNC